jgi:PhoPQ-activated pathogenicity-related protein
MRSFILFTLISATFAASSPRYAYLDGCEGYDCLDKYVNHPDPAYEWHDTGVRIHGKKGILAKSDWTGYVLNYTSQTWLTPADSDRSVWQHRMVVIVPANYDPKNNQTMNFGSMYMTGDCAGSSVPKSDDEDLLVSAYLATHTGTIAATLFQIPACPITFATDPIQKARTEDAIIAFTWQHFVNNPTQPEWLLRMPMTKAGVRGLDTLAAFTKTLYPDSNMDSFAVAGASKRGWNTWTVSAVDKRVKAAIPIVMDIWKMVPNLHHHFKAYGGWTFAFKDYWELNFTQKLDDPNTQLMANIIDPTNYPKTRSDGSPILQMPKLVINSCMDEFLLPDDTTFWWNDMQGKWNNHWLIVPNAEHSEATGVLELLPAAATFIRGVIRGVDATARPVFNWTTDEKTGEITVHQISKHVPIQVSMWSAKTATNHRRDFRVVNANNATECKAEGGLFVKSQGLCANLKSFWKRKTLTMNTDGTWTASMEPDADGKWTAFFVHMEYEGPKAVGVNEVQEGRRRLDWPISQDGHYQATTTVSIIPKTFPFADCHDDGCLGTLV